MRDKRIGGTMGSLYDDCQKVERYLESSGLDIYRSRGEIATRCGFLMPLVKPDDPDDDQMIQALHEAADEVLGLHLE